MGILGDFATIYVVVSMAIFGLGVLGLVVTRSRRYARMIAAAPVWPAVGAYYLLRPPTA
jgi:hypothetical protein